LKKVPVTSNDASIMAVYNGDAEVGFSFWDARSTIDSSEAPDLAEKLVVFGYTEMYPNGGVVISDDVPEERRKEITDLMDGFSEVDPDTMSAIFDITDPSSISPTGFRPRKSPSTWRARSTSASHSRFALLHCPFPTQKGSP
ncbi:MAG: hypothetical protein DI610_13555, partial [Staphylococcus hominis]